MSDLTDDELDMACTASDAILMHFRRLEDINPSSFVELEYLALARRLQRTALELRRLRAESRDVHDRHLALISKLESLAYGLDLVGGQTGCRAVADGIRRLIDESKP
jgi:hypothetical protein